MGQNVPALVAVDVICQHSKDGAIVPIRIRVTDEDGLKQAFTIKEYRELPQQGARTMPDGVYVTDHTMIFECKIVIFERLRLIRLYYEPAQMIWRMTG
ncbi:MAG: hypothetical protein K6E50_15650 [Lachnospiraceae bacterium]|nr:hypothetical protein [Lachnospiraceae bacterium]